GKLAPELFDRSFNETPKAFYSALEQQLDSSLEAVRLLDEVCVAKLGLQAAPSFTKLHETLQEVRHLAHQFLQKKRETDPDPVEPPPIPTAAAAPSTHVEPEASMEAIRPAIATVAAAPALPEAAEQDEATRAIASAAALLRRRDPHSPAPYLML